MNILGVLFSNFGLLFGRQKKLYQIKNIWCPYEYQLAREMGIVPIHSDKRYRVAGLSQSTQLKSFLPPHRGIRGIFVFIRRGVVLAASQSR